MFLKICFPQLVSMRKGERFLGFLGDEFRWFHAILKSPFFTERGVGSGRGGDRTPCTEGGLEGVLMHSVASNSEQHQASVHHELLI
jgi:hypothetical protein